MANGPLDELGATMESGSGGSSPSGAAVAHEKIGRFAIQSKLGEGGMGVVLLASDPVLGRKVALKLLHAGTDTDDDRRRRFMREAQAMAQLSHDNVVVVHEVGEHDGKVYVAMEYIAGGTLTKWQDGKAWREVLEMYARAGRGLAAAHAAGLVHRDFKPDNVLVGDDGRLRVTDFGLVGATGEKVGREVPDGLELAMSLTKTGAIMGTPRFMAPEQFLGEPVDARADQFSFCVALYEALYSEPPFAAREYAKLLAEVLTGAVRPPPKDSPVPASVRDAVLRGLQRDRDARFPSMNELLAHLAIAPTASSQAILTHVGASAPAPRRRRTIPVAVGAVALVGTAAVVAIVATRGHTPPSPPPPAAAVTAAATSSAPADAAAPDTPEPKATASQLYDAAAAAYARGDGEAAARDFLAAYELKPDASFLYNASAGLQKAYNAHKDPEVRRRAIELWERYLVAKPDTKDRAYVERQLSALTIDAIQHESETSGDFEATARAFVAAYEKYSQPELLYNAGIALQEVYKAHPDPGTARRAIEVYKRYVATKPDAKSRAAAERQINVLEQHQK